MSSEHSHFSSDANMAAERSPHTQHALKEKSKRPQLSCNSCRTRKVKCDRVQPCTACSLHQIAEQCQYDLTESERHPILQAEALREKDKEIARLRLEVLALGGSSTRSEAHGNDLESRKRRKSGFVVSRGKKPASLRQKKSGHEEAADSLFFGAPCLSNVIQELADLTLRSQAANLSHSPPHPSGQPTGQDSAPFPFPTLWPAKDGIPCLLALIPRKDEVFSYIDSFQRRVQGCSFPHVPEQCTHGETERFLAHAEHNALLRPDMLALLFAVMAQGLQHGLYDRCGEQWVAGLREAESKKGDVFVAAAMQALRQASFMSRPTLSIVETLAMIGSYLIDSGKLLDAWALFGVTVRLAQAIELHRDPSYLRPRPPAGELNTRKNLWWWILHLDQQYSITLGRPLGISSIGDCPTPILLRFDPAADSLSTYHSKFTILARQILSAGYLCNAQIDQFTDQILSLQKTLPESLRFGRQWLQKDTAVPHWPLNAQAASMHQKTHNFVILLNRQRAEEDGVNIACSNVGTTSHGLNYHGMHQGRERVLESCCEILTAFEFFHARVRVGLVCWTVCQQAFNAAHILVMAMVEYNATEYYPLVHQAYDTFRDIHQHGIHELAGAAMERIEFMINSLKAECEPFERVMSKNGMALLEYAEQQDINRRQFSPLLFNMVDSRKGDLEDGTIPLDNTSDTLSTKATKKHKSNTNDQKHKSYVKKGHRKDNVPQRRSSSGPWIRDNLQQLSLMNTFSTPVTPTHTYHSSELSSLDIESTLAPGSHTSSSSAPRDSPPQTLDTASATTSFHVGESKPWLYTEHSPTSTPAFPSTATTSSVSAPSSYHQSSFIPHHRTVRPINTCSVSSSRPPSLHLSSHPSSAYPNSFTSSLQTTSGLQTPIASHPVSPSLSQNQQYCLSQPHTQPHSPAWGVGFDDTMDCADLSMSLANNQTNCTEVQGRTWWIQGWTA